jgi:hypothetical protein
MRHADWRDRFDSITRRTFKSALLRLLEQEYKLIGSRRVLEMLVEEVERLQAEFYPDKNRLGPGTICWVTTKKTRKKPSYGKRTEDYEPVVIYLSLWPPEEVEKRVTARAGARNRNYEQSKARDMETMVRLIESAWDQEGMLSQAELAVLLNRSLTTIKRYVYEYEAQNPGKTLSLKGYLLDQGSRPTHKGIILSLYEQGLDPVEIGRRTEHGLDAVDRYIKAYERVKALAQKGMSVPEIRHISGLGERTVSAYLRIAQSFHPALKQAEQVKNDEKK